MCSYNSFDTSHDITSLQAVWYFLSVQNYKNHVKSTFQISTTHVLSVYVNLLETPRLAKFFRFETDIVIM